VKNLMRWVIRQPVAVLFFLVTMTLAAVWQLPGLKVHISPQGLSIADSPERLIHQQSLELFGSDNIVILYVRDPELFAPARIDALRDAVKRIEQLKCVSRTRSLFSIPYLREENEFIQNEPYLATTPHTPEAAAALHEAALKNPFVRNNLLSDDGEAMAINIYIRPMGDDPRFDERVTTHLDEITAALRPHFQEVFHVGAPEIREAIGDRILRDLGTIGPLAALLLFATLAIILRRPSGMVFPLVTAALSVVWTLGLMAATGYPINVMTAIVPILLIVIGSTEDIHLITEYYSGIAKGYRRQRAVQHMIRRMGLAVTLTFLTSFLGFLALGFNPIQLVREFVLVAAAGLAISFLVTVMTVPLALRYLGERSLTPRKLTQRHKQQRSFHLVSVALAHRRMVLGISAALVLVSAYFASTIQVNNNIMDYLDRDSEVNQQILRLQQDLSGLETFNIVVDGHVQDVFSQVHYLGELLKLQEFLAKHTRFDVSLSFADYVRVLNSVVDDERRMELPEEDEVVDTLAMFISPDKTRPYVTDDYSKANILVRHSLSSSAPLNAELSKLEQFISTEIDPALKVTITGHSILSNQASDFLAGSQVESLLFMMLVIFSVVALLFLNARAGLLAVVPNIFLVACLFGVIGLVGIPLDTGSTMIAAIALGISVDHTMHLLVRYYSLTRARVEPGEAIQQAGVIEFRPIFAATVSLTAGFLALGLSGFQPVVNFGLLSAMVMVLALYANFFLTPVLLSYVRLTSLWDVLSMPAREGLRTHCSLFKGMNELQVRHVLSFGTIRDYSVGESIFNRDDKGDELYVLLSGEVRICKKGEHRFRIITDEKKGDRIFGMSALVRSLNHFCPAEVMRDAKILVLNWERLAQIQRFRPRTGSTLFQNLSVIMATRALDEPLKEYDGLRSVS